MGKEEPDLRVTYGLSLRNNQITLQRLHDITSLLFGTVAGILQLESQYGFMFYLAGYTIVNLIVIYIVGGLGQLKKYYASIWSEFVLGNIGRSVSSYLMMWCLVYALIDS